MNLFYFFKEIYIATKSYFTTEFLKGESQVTNNPMTMTDLVNTYNQVYIRYYPELGGKVIDAQIFKNTPERNAVIANLIEENSKKYGIDPVYLAACIVEESRFSEKCFNHNLVEHKGVISFEGTDWGMTQQSGTYLPSRPGMPPAPDTKDMTTTEATSAIAKWQNEMIALAFTAEWSVPTMASIMSEYLNQSAEHLKTDTVLASAVHSLNTTTLSDAQALATSMYNRGASGAINDFKELNKSQLAHFVAVGGNFAVFNKVLKSS